MTTNAAKRTDIDDVAHHIANELHWIDTKLESAAEDIVDLSARRDRLLSAADIAHIAASIDPCEETTFEMDACLPEEYDS